MLARLLLDSCYLVEVLSIVKDMCFELFWRQDLIKTLMSLSLWPLVFFEVG